MTKTTKSSFLLIALGALLLMLEKRFYQYVNEQGVLQESLLLPMSVFAIIAGLMLLVIKLCLCLFRN